MRRFAPLVVAAFLAVPTAAFAQSPTAGTYGGQGGTSVTVTQASENPAVQAQGVSVTEQQAAATGPSCNVARAASARQTPSTCPKGESASAPQAAAGEGVAAAQGAEVAASRATQQAPSSGLPFTGLDLALIALGGALLLSMGIVMRRLAGATPRTGAVA